jgi:membrane protein DedA with SNARE-associated domain
VSLAWPYILVLLGMYLEGEVVLITSIIAAQHGHLDLWIVLTSGAVGTFMADCTSFFLGRIKGQSWVESKRRLRPRIRIIERRLHRHPWLVFFGYRFMYGFRSVVPIVLGVTRIKTVKFLIFSAVSIVVWIAVWGALGYAFGTWILTQLRSIKHAEKFIIGALIIVAIIVLIKRRKKSKKAAEADQSEVVDL